MPWYCDTGLHIEKISWNEIPVIIPWFYTKIDSITNIKPPALGGLEVAVYAAGAVEVLAAFATGVVELFDAIATVVMINRQLILSGKAYLALQEILALLRSALRLITSENYQWVLEVVVKSNY